MNGFHYLMGGVYCTPCDFASVTGVGNALESRFSDLPFEREAVLDRLRDVVGEFERYDGAVDAEKALRLLLARDLRAVGTTLERQEIDDPNESLLRHRDRYEASLRALGLDFSPPKLFIVESFPRPYDTMDWVATSPDRADYESYGIEPGNYFKRRHLTPIVSDILLAHEMIHQVIGEVDPYHLGRGLEEGIAVILGELYVAAQVVGADKALLYARYQWYDRRAGQSNRLYAQYARMAALIYQRYGLDGVLALVRGGRRKIKEVERACLAGDLTLDLPRGGWEDDYGDLLTRFTLTVEDLVVDPLTKYVASYLAVGKTVDQVAAEANVSRGDAEAALQELQHKTVLVVVDEGRVDYSDVDVVTPSYTFRYDV